VRNILFEGYLGPRLPREIQLKRVKRVICEELTDCQKQVVIAYYFQQQTIPEIARERGVNKSTVRRPLHRAEERIRRCLRY